MFKKKEAEKKRNLVEFEKLDLEQKWVKEKEEKVAEKKPLLVKIGK